MRIWVVFGILALSLLSQPSLSKTTDKSTNSIISFRLKPSKLHIGGRVKALPQFRAICLDRGCELIPESFGGYDYQWPGVYFEANFYGTQIVTSLNDNANVLSLTLDDRPAIILNRPGQIEYLISGLKDGLHHIRLEKLSESQYDTAHFEGFYTFSSDQPLPPPAYTRRIAYYGDSFSVGYGNLSPKTQCTDQEIHDLTNTSLAYPVLAAKALGADYHIMAFSGIGLIRNYDGHEHDKYRLPLLMDRALFDEPAPDSNSFQPHIIVINIGSNDFSTPLRADEKWSSEDSFKAEFTKSYLSFVEVLKSKNPNSIIILATNDEPHSPLSSIIDFIQATLAKKGITHILRLRLEKTLDTGCNAHPSLASHQQMSQTLVNFITKHPHIWPDIETQIQTSTSKN